MPFEPLLDDPENTLVFKIPARQGPADPADKISLWQQANLLVLVQREWSDNAVSNTLYFRPKWKLTEHHKTELTKYAPEKDIKEVASTRTKKIYETELRKTVVFVNKWTQQTEIMIYSFDPTHEENIIEPVLSSIAGSIKSASLLPHTAKGVYAQMPQQGITPEEYETLMSDIKPMDWAEFTGDAQNEEDKFCSGPTCTVG